MGKAVVYGDNMAKRAEHGGKFLCCSDFFDEFWIRLSRGGYGREGDFRQTHLVCGAALRSKWDNQLLGKLFDLLPIVGYSDQHEGVAPWIEIRGRHECLEWCQKVPMLQTGDMSDQ